jgi:hypothetical protein
MIANSESVISHFGYWPKFCDGKIERLSFEQQGVIELTINYIDAEQNKNAKIGLCFSGVTKIELNELHLENVIDSLTIANAAPFIVNIDAAYGLCGNFNCNDIKVVSFNV